MNPHDLPGYGLDTPQRRPGVPMELEPSPRPGAHWDEPAWQVPEVTVLHRRELPGLTPVVSNAVPPRGLSGALRRLAYSQPEHLARHWMVLLFADRVDVVESLARRHPLRVAFAGALGFLFASRRRRTRERRDIFPNSAPKLL